MPPAAPVLQRAVERHRAGDFPAVEALCREALRADPRDANAQQLLAVAMFQQRRVDEALAAIDRAVALAPASPDIQFNRGMMLAGAARPADAADAFHRALALAPHHLAARYNLGTTLLGLGDAEGARAAFEAVLARAPNEVDAIVNLGIALAAGGRLDEAAARFAHAVRLVPRHGEAWLRLAIAREQIGDAAGALEAYDETLRVMPDRVDAMLNRADCLEALGRLEEARVGFEAAAASGGAAADPRRRLGGFLLRRGDLVAARAVYAALLRDNPDDVEGRFGDAAAQFDVVYADEAALAESRARYRAALDRLTATLARRPDDPTGVAAFLPFYLPYQNGDDDIDLQRRFGAAVGDALRATAPALATRPPRERLRVGFVSAQVYVNSVWKLVTEGWLGGLDRDRFELQVYAVNRRSDSGTREARERADGFVSGLTDDAAWRRRLAEDACDVLVYPEIGLDPTVARLAATRLAPAQFATLAHPFTSGLRTIDGFLTSDLMEPEDGERHYVEKLVRLPNLAICYRPRLRTEVGLDRESLGLPAGRTAFLCCQSLYKYLPRHDRVLVEIARGVPDSIFVFIEANEKPATAAFRARLAAVFAEAGLDFADRVHVVRRLSPDEFEALAGLSDVYLDSLEWSGGNTTLECLARDLPVVTHAGRFMRGRHTTGIMRMMGLGERVAASEAAYVAEAIRLGRDSAARAEAAAAIAERKSRAFADPEPLAALADFLAGAARR